MNRVVEDLEKFRSLNVLSALLIQRYNLNTRNAYLGNSQRSQSRDGRNSDTS